MRSAVLATLAVTALVGVAVAQGAAPKFITLDQADMLSSNVVGTDVYDYSGHSVGKIQDVAFDGNKNLKGYIVSVGGFLGMGTRYVAVDQDSVKVKYDPADKKWHANMNATRDELKGAPEFKYQGQWYASKS